MSHMNQGCLLPGRRILKKVKVQRESKVFFTHRWTLKHCVYVLRAAVFDAQTRLKLTK